MDPYDVLGVRANATCDEIELAYKGRRSQYHPDRYSDPEGIAWATAKMQELNAAYANIQQHADDRATQHRANTHSSQQTTPTRSRKPGTLGEFLMNNPSILFESNKIFFQPNIPRKKLRAALESYGDGLARGDVRILIDDTVFGGAREGAIFTDAEVRFKEMFLESRDYVLGAIKSFRADGLALYLNGEKSAKFHIPEKWELRLLCGVLNKFAKESASFEETASPREEDARSKGSQSPSMTPNSGTGLDGQAMFRSLHGNIFGSILLSVNQTNRQPTNKVGQELGRLCWAILDMAMTMPDEFRSNALALTEDEKEVLSSDTIRLELLLFILSCVVSGLRDECEEEEVEERFAAISMITLTPYVFFREGFGSLEGDISSSSAAKRLRNSTLLQKAMKRLGSYQETIALGGNPGRLFIEQMRVPTDFALIESEAAKEMSMYIANKIRPERFLAPISRHLEMLQSRTSELVSHFVFTT